MRLLIGNRQGEGTPKSRPRSVFDPSRTLPIAVDELLSDADRDLTHALANHEALQKSLKDFATIFKEVAN